MSDYLKSLLDTLSVQDVIAVVLVLIVQRIAAQISIGTYYVVSLPGTIAHEWAHYLVAYVLGGRPSFPDLKPQREKYGWRMGSVTFRSAWYRNGAAGMAPLLLSIVSLWWAAHYLAGMPFDKWYVLNAWIAGTFLAASLPSSQDFKVAGPTLIAVGIGFAVWLWAYFYYL